MRMRRLLLAVVPKSPSVSRHSTPISCCIAAYTPIVQEFCSAEVGNTCSPLKKVWFMVCDLPSPVLPNIDMTFILSFSEHFSFLQNISGVAMCKFSLASMSSMDWPVEWSCMWSYCVLMSPFSSCGVRNGMDLKSASLIRSGFSASSWKREREREIMIMTIFFYSKAKAQGIPPINALHCIGLKKKR